MNIYAAFILTVCSCSSLFAQEMTMEERGKKQCRSVHLFHEDIPANSKALLLEVKPIKTAPGTYFCAAVFDFAYIGFQDIPGKDNNAVIFSVWDPVDHGNNPEDVPENERTGIVKANAKAEVSRFGGEGTGGKSMLRYQWEIGESMKFLVVLNPLNEQFKEVSGYFFNNKSNTWEFISRWKTHRSKNEISQATSFVEDFRRNYESIKYERSAEFGPYYVLDESGNWKLSKKVTFCADQTPSKFIAAKLINKKNSTFMLSTGGEKEISSDLILEHKFTIADEETEEVPTQHLNDIFEQVTTKEA